jgi:serine protease AprX
VRNIEGVAMEQTRKKRQPAGREERHSAAWGKRFGVLVLVLVAELAFARTKLSPELQHAKAGKLVDVIVQFTSDPTEHHIGKVTSKGASLRQKLSVVHGAAFTSVPSEALSQLARDSEVAYITLDRPVHGTSNFDYTPESVNAPWAWQQESLDGTGIGVAVIDSGVYAVGDLYWYNPTNGSYGSRVVYSQSFVRGTTDASDYYGHGTHVAGIIASAGWFSSGSHFSHAFKGIAPNANIINLRALDQNGAGTDSSVIAAIDAAIRLKSKYNIRVINLSLGRQVYESYTIDPLCQAVESAWKAGIVVVVAAGNQGRNNSAGTNGYGTIAAPGNDPYVITVGAMKTANTSDRGDDTVASYSSKGPTAFDHVVKPDIVAPGNKVVSLLSPRSRLPLLYPAVDVLMSEYADSSLQQFVMAFTGSDLSPNYMRLSGTSMAAPVVSGAAALMIQANPTLTPDTVKARLMESATKTFPADSTTTDPVTGQTYVNSYDIFTVGAGYVDIEGALLNTSVLPSTFTAHSPAVAYDSTSRSVYIVSNTSVVWGSSAAWSQSVVWGSSEFSSSTINGQPVVSGESVVWGAGSPNGFSVLWGSSVVWGSSTQSVMNILAGKNER